MAWTVRARLCGFEFVFVIRASLSLLSVEMIEAICIDANLSVSLLQVVLLLRLESALSTIFEYPSFSERLIEEDIVLCIAIEEIIQLQGWVYYPRVYRRLGLLLYRCRALIQYYVRRSRFGMTVDHIRVDRILLWRYRSFQ